MPLDCDFVCDGLWERALWWHVLALEPRGHRSHTLPVGRCPEMLGRSPPTLALCPSGSLVCDLAVLAVSGPVRGSGQ